jgi:endonuclease-3
MRLEERYSGIIGYFLKNNPVAQTELVFRDPYELIVSVVLSAQCTDRRVNMTTPELFKRYPTVRHLAAAEPEEVLELIKSISYPNSKARHLVGLARKLLSDFGGEVPSDVDLLMTLPGVGRKTANVVASVIFAEPVIAVDTHVFRVSHRLGLSKGKTPRAVELDLERHIPEDLRAVSHHWLILHGRYVCTAKSPRCTECGLSDWCREYSGKQS